ncbi:MAG: hypothetical protein JWR35_860 [Marmoricola sp.]|jgi:hypothetical protein|nr:hypothetical protein [Marmoricola sp.]
MTTDDATGDEAFPDRKKQKEAEVNAIRERIAKVIRIVFVTFAAVLALAALLVAIRNNVSETNGLVKFVKGFADKIDGPFSRDNGIFAFTGSNAETKDAVTNWGLAAVVYIVIGRVLDRLVSPKSK